MPPRIWTRCSHRHLHVTTVPTQINEACITNFIISTNMLTNISHYIPRTVVASSLQDLPFFRTGAGGAALQPRLVASGQSVPPDHPAEYAAPLGALPLDRR